MVLKFKDEEKRFIYIITSFLLIREKNMEGNWGIQLFRKKSGSMCLIMLSILNSQKNESLVQELSFNAQTHFLYSCMIFG